METINNLTEKTRSVFERRLSITKVYDAERRRAEKEHRATGTSFEKRPFTNKFAQAKGVNPGTVYRWWRKYIKEGEAGLIPGYGKNKGKTIIKDRMSHLIDHLIVPSNSTGEIVRKFLAACDAAGERPPCVPTIRTYIKSKREVAGEPYETPKHAPPWDKFESRIALLEKEIAKLREEFTVMSQ